MNDLIKTNALLINEEEDLGEIGEDEEKEEEVGRFDEEAEEDSLYADTEADSWQ